MLPHTGLFLLWKVALQIRIRSCLKGFSDRHPLHGWQECGGKLCQAALGIINRWYARSALAIMRLFIFFDYPLLWLLLLCLKICLF